MERFPVGGPLSKAGLILQNTAVLEGMYTHPHLVHRLLDKCTELYIDFVKAQLERVPGVVNVNMHDTWWPELNRFDHMEQHEWDVLVRMRHILREVEDIHGNRIFTDDQMFVYLQQFERDFHRAKAGIIDATEGGVKKAGAEIMSLAEVRDRFCREAIPAACFDLSDMDGALDLQWRDEVIDLIDRRSVEIKEVRDIYGKCRDLLARIRDAVMDQPLVNSLIAEMEELKEEAMKRQLVYRMVVDSNSPAEWRKLHRDKEILEKGLQGIEKQRAQAERDVEYMQSLVDCCDVLLDYFSRGCERLKRFDFAAMRPEEEMPDS